MNPNLELQVAGFGDTPCPQWAGSECRTSGDRGDKPSLTALPRGSQRTLWHCRCSCAGAAPERVLGIGIRVGTACPVSECAKRMAVGQLVGNQETNCVGERERERREKGQDYCVGGYERERDGKRKEDGKWFSLNVGVSQWVCKRGYACKRKCVHMQERFQSVGM